MQSPQKTGSSNAGLIIREREPVNLESPFDQLDGILTSNALFYVRNHFKTPHLCHENYELRVDGAVDSSLSLRLADLLAMPSITRVATLECAGNSRIFLVPQVQGAQWELGAISTAEWTGVPLTLLLERAGIHSDACEILFEGADSGMPKEQPQPPSEIHYTRSLPLTKASDVLLAYKMNGEDLPGEHGAPVRAIVPGHYGMASVKWLTRVRVLTEPFLGYFHTSDYAFWDYDENQNPVRCALGEIKLKSAIARPRPREVLEKGQPYEIFGAAWSGECPVASVQLSVDDGKTWNDAKLIDPVQAGVWRRWRYVWNMPSQPGIYVLKSRAIDAAGNSQPQEHDKRFGSYAVHHSFGIEVTVN